MIMNSVVSSSTERTVIYTSVISIPKCIKDMYTVSYLESTPTNIAPKH